MILLPKLILDTWGLLGSILGALSVQFFHPFSDAEFGSFLEGRFLCPFYLSVCTDFAPKTCFGYLDPFEWVSVQERFGLESHSRSGLSPVWSRIASSLRFKPGLV